jgi:hypothetical protein
MKTNQILSKTFIFALCLCAAARFAFAEDLTAFRLIKEGNRYIGEQSKDKVVQIRSDKSVASLTPNIWYIVYYDPDAPLKAVEVKLGGGQRLDVSRPMRLFEPVTGEDKILDRSKFKIDSDRALKIATKQPVLENLTLKASQLSLVRGDDGPVWKVKLWATKLKHPDQDADIGETIISAYDGSIIKADLHPDSVD